MNGPVESAELCGLIASRICHDLISPVGAISNGLELLEMAPEGGAEETALIRQSADAATASLKFMRIAFGAPGVADMMAMSDVARIFTAYLNQGRREARWTPGDGGMSRADAQLLYLAALSVADAAPMGGALTVETVSAEPLRLSVAIAAPRIQAAEAPAKTPTPRDAHHILLHILLAARGGRADWDVTTGGGAPAARLTLTAP